MGERSTCPITCSLDLIGDRWTLVILRDLLLANRRHFSDFARAENIATNILSERLARLELAGIVEKKRDPEDGRRRIYVATQKGHDLRPVLFALAEWGVKHTDGAMPHGVEIPA